VVTFTGFVPDEQLAALYNATTMLVLPSFNEGFGLPVVEAMSCGLPVAVSDRSSLPEVVGNAGLLFDPTSTEQIAEAMRRMLTDEPLRHAMRRAGLERARAYSWQSSAREMMRVLEQTARGARGTG
jgi:glycosyltransferase involved in cell wall biosynthesis